LFHRIARMPLIGAGKSGKVKAAVSTRRVGLVEDVVFFPLQPVFNTQFLNSCILGKRRYAASFIPVSVFVSTLPPPSTSWRSRTIECDQRRWDILREVLLSLPSDRYSHVIFTTLRCFLKVEHSSLYVAICYIKSATAAFGASAQVIAQRPFKSSRAPLLCQNPDQNTESDDRQNTGWTLRNHHRWDKEILVLPSWRSIGSCRAIPSMRC